MRGASSPSSAAADRIAAPLRPRRSALPPAAPSPPAARLRCRVARSGADLDAHYALRHEVFVHEQQLFDDDDRDPRDAAASTLHAIGLAGRVPCGAVRLYPLEDGTPDWKGDRLAVLPGQRAHHLGAELVRFAVFTAGSLGGRRMFAHVQLPNVSFFQRLGWVGEGSPTPFHGTPHQLMSIGLARP